MVWLTPPPPTVNQAQNFLGRAQYIEVKIIRDLPTLEFRILLKTGSRHAKNGSLGPNRVYVVISRKLM